MKKTVFAAMIAALAATLSAAYAKDGANATSPNKKVAQFVKWFFDDHDFKYRIADEREDKTIFTGDFSGFDGIYGSFRFMLVAEDDTLQCFCFLPTSVAEAKRIEIAEFIARANYGLRYGNFEMDFSDGEVRYHMALPASAVRADDANIARIVALPPRMLERYSDGFVAVLSGTKKPKQAVDDCEKDTQE